ncbi:hypothetical protein Pint_25182 [Pistacia integerrima]|uniref:Uncharacterized protein n=1 Tax=Pistacia integerrima TaxID=434235 RepID=A0ACC0YEY4_9ROSI|nr:hypothetical protein Pint_25182 [Pistacia integerrima]
MGIAQTLAPSADINRRLIRLKFKVHIINGFLSNRKPLIIHCYSRDDDLGEHTLWMNDSFNFHFRVSLIRFTHFWCFFQWDSHYKRMEVFQLDDEYNLCFDTANCYWLVDEDGFFLSADNATWYHRNDWNP